MTATPSAEELTSADLLDLGIEHRYLYTAYRYDKDTINLVIHDIDNYDIDDPSIDQSGEDAWEVVWFADGNHRAKWMEESGYDKSDPNYVLLERYEHGRVKYAPIGESSAVDRSFDVAGGVGVIHFTKPDTFGVPLIEVARSICDEYSAWRNGDVYGIVAYKRRPAVDAPNCPILIPKKFRRDKWVRTDSVWGIIGSDAAEEMAASDSY